MNEKQKLLYNLMHETYCRLGVSTVHGVGVFAIRDIPYDVDPFKLAIPSHERRYNLIELTTDDIKPLPPSTRKLLDDFLCSEINGSYYVPANGLNDINISFYLNHSTANSNVELVKLNTTDNSHQNEFSTYFRTTREIKAGEELFFDYDTLYQ